MKTIILLSFIILCSCEKNTPEPMNLDGFKPIEFNSGYVPPPPWKIRDRTLKIKWWKWEEKEREDG